MPPQYLSTLPRNKGRNLQRNNPVRQPINRNKNVPKPLEPRLIVPPPKVDLSSGKPSRIPILKRYHSAEKQSLENRAPVAKSSKKSRIAPLVNQRQINSGFNTKTASLTRPVWGKLSQPDADVGAQARVPIRRRRATAPTQSPIDSDLKSSDKESGQSQGYPSLTRSDRFSTSAVNKRKPVLIEQSFDTFPRTPVPLPRTISILTNRPTPKPRKFSFQRATTGSIRKTLPKRTPVQTPTQKDTTWPRKNSINLRRKVRPRFFSDINERQAGDKFRPIWLPVGTKKPENPNDVFIVIKELSKRRTTPTNSFKRNKLRSSNLSHRRFSKTLNKDKIPGPTKSRWMPTGKFNVSTLRSKTKAKVENTFNKTQFNKLKNQLRPNTPTKNEKQKISTTYKKRNSITETNGQPLKPTKIPTPILPRRKKKPTPTATDVQGLKRKRNSNNSNENEANIVVEKDSYSPLFVKPICTPAKRQSKVSEESKPKLLWLPPGRPLMQAGEGGKLERRLSRIPVKVKAKVKQKPKSRIAWLPASKYTRLQSFRDYARCHPEALQPFQITV